MENYPMTRFDPVKDTSIIWGPIIQWTKELLEEEYIELSFSIISYPLKSCWNPNIHWTNIPSSSSSSSSPDLWCIGDLLRRTLCVTCTEGPAVLCRELCCCFGVIFFWQSLEKNSWFSWNSIKLNKLCRFWLDFSQKLSLEVAGRPGWPTMIMFNNFNRGKFLRQPFEVVERFQAERWEVCFRITDF